MLRYIERNMQSSSSNYSPEDVGKLEEELPKMLFMGKVEMFKWEGFWLRDIKPTITFRSSFLARDDDVILASTRKTGTTWLKALALCIMQNHQTLTLESHDILTKKNPHFYVPTMETVDRLTQPPSFDPYDASVARLLHTHLPYSLLPDSVKNSNCKIVYIARNPKDTVISMWHFYNSLFMENEEPYSLEKMVDCFCSGVHIYGPFFEHVVGYWEESKKSPEKVLFIKYEELKSDPRKQVMVIAEFLGRPFADERGAAEVVRRCSFDRLKNLEVNKSGYMGLKVENSSNKSGNMGLKLQHSSFFRKGEVGDWKNYLTPEMEMKINQMCRLKFEPFGLFL